MSTSTLSAVIPAILLALLSCPQTDSKGRVVMEKADTPKMRKLRSSEVISWADHGETVVAVTEDGQKYSAAIPADVRKKLDAAAAPAPANPPASTNPPAK